jgi:hypothetical protein
MTMPCQSRLPAHSDIEIPAAAGTNLLTLISRQLYFSCGQP